MTQIGWSYLLRMFILHFSFALSKCDIFQSIVFLYPFFYVYKCTPLVFLPVLVVVATLFRNGSCYTSSTCCFTCLLKPPCVCGVYGFCNK